MLNEELECFELFKENFSKKFENLNKQMELNTINLNKIYETDLIYPYNKNKEACSKTVGFKKY